MKYSVVTEDGRCLGGGAGAADAESEQGEQGAGDGKAAPGGTAVREFLSGHRDKSMLRMANQSIFADMLEVSTRSKARSC